MKMYMSLIAKVHFRCKSSKMLNSRTDVEVIVFADCTNFCWCSRYCGLLRCVSCKTGVRGTKLTNWLLLKIILPHIIIRQIGLSLVYVLVFLLVTLFKLTSFFGFYMSTAWGCCFQFESYTRKGQNSNGTGRKGVSIVYCYYCFFFFSLTLEGKKVLLSVSWCERSESNRLRSVVSIFTHGYEALWISGILFCCQISLETCETKETELSR